ncbi:MAG: DNA sulfur modification protein DndB [Gammaproteobacteria bacterium]|nr:DNA sulfur modification protein DndB [Gammaproteobacteria bacterium]
MSTYLHSFPAVRGIQSGRPCYIAMCPMRVVPTLFKFDEEEVPPELRAQRTLNLNRVPEIASYLLDNPQDYTLSCVTASINSKVSFAPSEDIGLGANIGTLTVPMDAQIIINDGQHRRKAIEAAIKENPELGHDSIPVMFFIDEGLARAQQMFADLNKHAVRPSDSLSTLYDLRDQISELGRHVQKNVHVFSRTTEMEKSSISNRSLKLFTLSAIKNATKALLKKSGKDTISKGDKDLAVKFWNDVAANMPDWQKVLSREIAPSGLRESFVHAHGVTLQAIGIVGSELLLLPERSWKAKLKKLKSIDWSRINPAWEGRAMNNGRISKATYNVARTAIYIKKELNMPLRDEDKQIEQEFT